MPKLKHIRHTKEDVYRWADIVSTRLVEQWQGKEDILDAKLLKKVFKNVFTAQPVELDKLIGTSIIEEDYFKKQGL